MSDNQEIIALLNDVLTAEITAINQYFVHAELFNHWGYSRTAGIIRKDSIDEMRHAEQMIERVLFLDGMPNIQRLGNVKIGKAPTEIFEVDLALEREAIPRLNAGIDLCRKLGDNGTRMLLEAILLSEETHVEWLETQLKLIENLGEKAYLSQQINVG